MKQITQSTLTLGVALDAFPAFEAKTTAVSGIGIIDQEGLQNDDAGTRLHVTDLVYAGCPKELNESPLKRREFTP